MSVSGRLLVQLMPQSHFVFSDNYRVMFFSAKMELKNIEGWSDTLFCLYKHSTHTSHFIYLLFILSLSLQK